MSSVGVPGEWDSYATAYPQIDNEADMPPLLGAALGLVAGDKLLDVGCGEGSLLDLVASAFPGAWKTMGFEISQVRGERAQLRGHEVVVSEDGRVPLPDGVANVVTSTHVVEHVPDDRAYVSELARLTHPGGAVYLETPLKLKGAWYFRRNPEAGWVLDPTHLREYRSTAEVVALVEEAGLEVLATDETRISYPLGAAEQVARRVLGWEQRTARPTGWRAARINIPRYRQVAVLARKPS